MITEENMGASNHSRLKILHHQLIGRDSTCAVRFFSQMT
jgi:hypothetical protein